MMHVVVDMQEEPAECLVQQADKEQESSKDGEKERDRARERDRDRDRGA